MRRIALVAVLTGLFGCGGGGDDPPAGGGPGGGGATTATRYCNFAADGVCEQWTGPNTDLTNHWATACAQADGGENVGACATQNRFGRCTIGQAPYTIVIHVYSPPLTPQEADTFKTTCAGPGFTWQDG